jgi:hypothetical protein
VNALWTFRLPTLADGFGSRRRIENRPLLCGHQATDSASVEARDRAKSLCVLFLNCTKNTELTAGQILRTFTFAHTKKYELLQPDSCRLRAATDRSTVRRSSKAMKSVEWKTYRTRFLIKAKQLSSPLSFTDHLGREHCGRKGDYLVESCDGVLSIAPRQIFEDIYVPIREAEVDEVSATVSGTGETTRLPAGLPGGSIGLEPIGPAGNMRVEERRRSDPYRSTRAPRKSPQSVRSAPSRLGFM